MIGRPLATLIDRLGASWSLLCAVHCAALPVLLLMAPALVSAGWWDERLERVTVVLVSLVATSSLAWGWWRHRARFPMLLLLPGLALMWCALWFSPIHSSVLWHAVAMASGGLLVALAHLANIRSNQAHGVACACRTGAC